jgi:hypothetical protein
MKKILSIAVTLLLLMSCNTEPKTDNYKIGYFPETNEKTIVLDPDNIYSINDTVLVRYSASYDVYVIATNWKNCSICDIFVITKDTVF